MTGGGGKLSTWRESFLHHVCATSPGGGETLVMDALMYEWPSKRDVYHSTHNDRIQLAYLVVGLHIRSVMDWVTHESIVHNSIVINLDLHYK